MTDHVTLQPYLPGLCEAIRNGNKALSDQWRSQDVWATVEQLVTASAGMHSLIMCGLFE